MWPATLAALYAFLAAIGLYALTRPAPQHPDDRPTPWPRQQRTPWPGWIAPPLAPRVVPPRVPLVFTRTEGWAA